MKNVTTNKKPLFLIMVFTIVLVILLMFVMTDLQSVRVNAKAKDKNTSTNDVDYLNETVFKMFGKKISKVDTWYNIDDTLEYI